MISGPVGLGRDRLFAVRVTVAGEQVNLAIRSKQGGGVGVIGEHLTREGAAIG